MISKSTARVQIRGALLERKGRDQTQTVVGPVHLDIQGKEFISVVGPPGCGKTALLKMIAGILPLSGGEIFISAENGESGGRPAGLALQAPALLPWRSAMQNVLLQAEILGLDMQECKNRARRLLAWFGLSEYEDRKPHEFPPGAGQAISICRALIHNPTLLLLDDPFRGMDAMSLEQVLDNFQRLWAEAGNTAILCTSDLLLAVLLSDRIAVMSPAPGRILECISVELPRPRRQDRAMTPQIADYCHRLRMQFRAQGVLR